MTASWYWPVQVDSRFAFRRTVVFFNMFNRESHGKVWFSAARCRFDVTLQDEFASRENPNPLLRHLLKHTNQHKIWWRQQMATASALLAIYDGNSPVTGEFPAQRPVTRGFGVFCDLRLNKRLSKQSWGWWFETPLRYLWRHCNVIGTLPSYPFQIPMQCKHDDVIKWKHFHVTGTLCGEFTDPGEFPTQRPVTRSFDFFFDLRLDKRLSKQWWGWWFETPSWSLWCQCNGYPSETHLTLKSCEISFIHNIRLNRSIVSRFCSEHGSDALIFFLICVWINGWVNNGEAGDLRRHRGHYDVNVMDIRPKRILHLNLAKSRSSITSVWIVQSFRDFAQSTAVMLPCSVRNFETIR